MNRGKRRLLKAYLFPEEMNQLREMAGRMHLTVSELVRRLVLGRSLPDSAGHEAVKELSRINADLARLGNLFRMALSDPEFRPPDGVKLEEMFAMIRDLQDELKVKIREM